MAKEKKKKKVDPIKREMKHMIAAIEEALEEYVRFKKGNMSAAKRARASLMIPQKQAKEVRKMIQEKKNKRKEKEA